MKKTGKPFVIFITGPAGCGKKSLAARLSSKYQYFIKHIDMEEQATQKSKRCCICRNHDADQIHAARNPGCFTKNKTVIPDPSEALVGILRIRMEQHGWGKYMYLSLIHI